MIKLPILTGTQLVSALSALGFQVVPVHAGETIGRGLLSRILRDCEISRDQLLNSL